MFHNNILGWLNPDVWCLTSCHWLLPDLLQHGIHLHWLIPIHAVWHPTINGWIPVAVCNPSNRLLGKIYIFFWSAKNATPAAGLQALSRLHLRGSSSCFTLCQCHGPWFHPMWNIDEKNRNQLTNCPCLGIQERHPQPLLTWNHWQVNPQQAVNHHPIMWNTPLKWALE